ncbi:MAG: DUF2835 family protein [Aeromonas sp.]
MNVRHYTFALSLSAEKILLMYQGHARRLVVRTDQGVSLEIGLEKIRPFVTRTGVQGHFRLLCDAQNRFVSLERLR